MPALPGRLPERLPGRLPEHDVGVTRADDSGEGTLLAVRWLLQHGDVSTSYGKRPGTTPGEEDARNVSCPQPPPSTLLAPNIVVSE